MDYNYPLRHDWSTDEIIMVTEFYTAIEKAYEEGIKTSEMLTAYNNFKKVVPSKAEEKTLFNEFEKVSRYKSYPIVKEAKAGDKEMIKG